MELFRSTRPQRRLYSRAPPRHVFARCPKIPWWPVGASSPGLWWVLVWLLWLCVCLGSLGPDLPNARVAARYVVAQDTQQKIQQVKALRS